MANSKMKTYLKGLTVIGLIALVGGGAGTFASFNAETTNKENTFQTGTLLLSDSVKSGTACFSNEGTGNAFGGCTAIIKTGELKPGHGESNFLTIKNSGTLSSSDLKLFGSACENKTTGTFEGTDKLSHEGDVCKELLISVEKDKKAGTEAEKCLIGTGTTACEESKGTPLKAWLEANNEASKAYAFGGDKLAAGDERFYKVYLYLPESVNNEFQGRTAKFDLTWHIDQ